MSTSTSFTEADALGVDGAVVLTHAEPRNVSVRTIIPMPSIRVRPIPCVTRPSDRSARLSVAPSSINSDERERAPRRGPLIVISTPLEQDTNRQRGIAGARPDLDRRRIRTRLGGSVGSAYLRAKVE